MVRRVPELSVIARTLVHLRLELNASVTSSRQLGSTGQIAVVVDGAPAVIVDIETWLVP